MHWSIDPLLWIHIHHRRGFSFITLQFGARIDDCLQHVLYFELGFPDTLRSKMEQQAFQNSNENLLLDSVQEK